jgi:hypothetical protein
VKSLKQKRNAAEKEKQKKGDEIEYPSYETLKKEGEQQDPYFLFTIKDASGNTVRKLKTSITKGVQKINWDLRYLPFEPVSFTPFDDSYPWITPDRGYMVLPGTYSVSLHKFEDGKFMELVAPQTFKTTPLNDYVLAGADKASLDEFNRKVAELSRAMSGADAYRTELAAKIPYLKQAILSGANVPIDTYEQVVAIQGKLTEVNRKMNGDNLRARYEGAAPPSLKGRIDEITGALWNTTSAPTETFKASYQLAASNFETILTSLKAVRSDIEKVEAVLEKHKAPYTPGRLPAWSNN